MTFMEQFTTIQEKMSKLNTTTLPDDFAMQVNLTDDDCGGIFYISNIGGKFDVQPYDYYDHTVLLTVKSKEFMQILAGKLDATDALFRGLLELEGNIDHAQIMATLVKKPAAKKPAAKKPAAKKPAAKKPAAKKPAAKKK